MKLTDVVAITGIGGLHKIVGRTKTGLIVESLVESGKPLPTTMHDKVSVLDDISMYTENGDMKLSEVLLKIHTKGDVPTAKDQSAAQRKYLTEVIQLDSERVYDSDIKKLLNWYHILANVTSIETLVAEEVPAATETSETANAEIPGQEIETPKPKKAAKKTAQSAETSATEETAKPKAKTTRKKKTEE
ncbi:MAG: DUF5606 domain-containing protein [Bacteroidota bacterium]